jgi:hypothetical protein
VITVIEMATEIPTQHHSATTLLTITISKDSTNANITTGPTTSSQTSKPDNDMDTSSSGEYLAIISQLMVEKDRLISEEDEFVVSKDRLWREMHQILQEKNKRILFLYDRRRITSHPGQKRLENQRLRVEIGDRRRHNRELKQVLRDALETGDDCEDETMEDRVFASPAEGALDEHEE